MKALVVGGNGFIGSHLVDQLLDNRWEVNVLDINERRYERMPPEVHFIRGDLNQSYLVRESLIGVDVVFHLAWATIHEISNQDPAADVYTNLIPSIHLIENSRQAGVHKIVFTSSGGTVYGPASQLPIPESHSKNPISAYGITKLAVEKYLQMFWYLNGIDYVVLRPSVPYGPRQNPFGRQGAVAVFLYRIMHKQPITIWGDGTTTRDFFYISDLVDAMVASAEQELENRIYNIGGIEEVSLIELVERIEKVTGKKSQVVFQPTRKFDVPKLVLDTRLAKKELGWSPKVSLEQGLRRTWNWMSTAIH